MKIFDVLIYLIINYYLISYNINNYSNNSFYIKIVNKNVYIFFLYYLKTNF